MSSLILILDNNLHMQQMLNDLLTREGYRVTIANEVEDALEAACQAHPDLILLDRICPKMEGFNFLRQYREIKQTPVIIITAGANEEDIVLGFELGADDYIIKPFLVSDFLERVRIVLCRADTEKRLAGQMDRGKNTKD
jgi:DNA-binding response OmpR family regulator